MKSFTGDSRLSQVMRRLLKESDRDRHLNAAKQLKDHLHSTDGVKQLSSPLIARAKTVASMYAMEAPNMLSTMSIEVTSHKEKVRVICQRVPTLVVVVVVGTLLKQIREGTGDLNPTQTVSSSSTTLP
ncbi:Hypothetical predicted protein [Octopus vulgaris]|uniref:Uncharacterized protein n=1 Tax=Octopus vulgaris TaxID=6645 RepID=A0AA36FB76_OCTVU|nr:Hypothetical predicted protein [Octopus vulgaris]